MRLICLDTETTGFSAEYDRIIEIGCVDITNGLQNKTTFQCYINPKRSVPESAVKIHGLTYDFLEQFQTIDHYLDDFLEFIKNSTLIIHNANFDMRFLNAELKRHNKEELTNPVIDTVTIARTLFPGKKAGLDALKNYFNINIQREYHGALLDAEILAQVYINMQTEQMKLEENSVNINSKNLIAEKICIKATIQENETHENIIQTLYKN